MARTADPKPASRFLVLATVCLVVVALYFAQEVLIPIALAILLSFLLAPLVRVLERVRLPRAVAVVVSVLVAFGVIVGVGFVVYNQLADLTPRLPGYAKNVQAKIDSMQGPGGLLNWFSHVRTEARKLAQMPAHPASRPASGPATMAADSTAALATVAGQPPPANPATQPTPTPVEVVNQQQATSPLAVARSVAEGVLGKLGTAFIIVVFTVFMLLQREDLRDRVIRLVGRDRLTTTTEALDDAAGRVSRYLVFQSITNGSVGVIVMSATFCVGHVAGTPFPSPALWGLLTALMRFIPYVGIWISALMPVLLSLAVFTSVKWAFVVLGVYLVTELVTANAIEPMLFGSSTGLGSLAVLVAAAFWTWLWGPVGLLLSTPLTVCLVVMGKYVPALNFLNVLLSDEPALSPPDRVYQRLLALDQEEAADLVHEYAKHMELEQLYDEVLLPAVALVESDVQRGGVASERRDAIRKAVHDIADEMGDRAKAKAAADAKAAPRDGHAAGRVTRAQAAAAAAGQGGLSVAPADVRVHLPDGCVLNVVCLPAHDASDQLAATMFGQLLSLRGYCVTVVSTEQLASEMVSSVEAAQPDAVVIAALPPAAITHARYLCKRLAGHAAGTELIVGLWTAKGDLQLAHDRLAAAQPVRVAASLRATIGQLHEILQPKLVNAALAARPT